MTEGQRPRGSREPLDTAYAVAADAMVRDLSGPDAAEGIDAFLEKRTAVWPSASGGVATAPSPARGR